MVYGYYIEDCVGNQRFFTEGCNYCQMTTGGGHASNCPMKGVKIPDIPAYPPNIYQTRDTHIIRRQGE